MQLASRWPRATGLLQAAAAITAFFSVATFADHLHRYLELFSHFRLQYLCAAVVFAISFAILRNRAWAITMTALAVINALPVSMWYRGETAHSTATATITVMHANVLVDNHETNKLAALIRSEKPDLVFLQEVNARWIDSLDELRQAYPHHHEIPQEDKFGIAVYARKALIDVKVIASPPLDFPTLLTHVAVDDRTIAFLSTHPPPPIGAFAYNARNEQLAAVAELIANLDGPTVLIGDLNTTMWGQHYDQLLKKTNLRDARHGFGVIPTWPRELPFARIPIDHCLISDELAVLDIRSGPSIGSDHLPLIVELALLE